MGVTGNRQNTYDFQYISNELNHIENYLDPVLPQDSNIMAVEAQTEAEAKKSLKDKKVRKPRYKFFMDRSVRSAKKGVRQARRTENTNFLLTVSEKDEPVEPAELDFVELVEHGLSPFATLFVECEKMKIWNEFINQSEDEQQRTLSNGNHGNKGDDSGSDDGSSGSFERLDSTGSFEVVDDRRTAHPAYTAEQCFQRIEHKLRAFLRKRHLPLGTLLSLEEDVITFFQEWPESVYVSRLETSYDRMILHALCQYLNLDSRSYDDDAGVRQTQVENAHGDFILPSMTLSNYIEYRTLQH